MKDQFEHHRFVYNERVTRFQKRIIKGVQLKRHYSSSDLISPKDVKLRSRHAIKFSNKANAGVQVIQEQLVPKEDDLNTDDIAFECKEADLLTHVESLLYNATLECEDSITQLIEDHGDCIRLQKDTFLSDIKRFIYNYCTTGQLLPKEQVDGASLLASDPGVKLKLLKVINFFKQAIQKMQGELKNLKHRVTDEIASRQAVHRMQQNAIKGAMSR